MTEPDIAKSAVQHLLDRGILINRTHDTVLRFLPPYIIKKKHVDQVVSALDSALSANPAVATRSPAKPERGKVIESSALQINRESVLPPAASELWSRDLVSSRDLSPAQAEAILNLTAVVKARPADFRSALAGKHIVMFFEKASLRTRLTFEAGMSSLGGNCTFVDQTKERLGERENSQRRRAQPRTLGSRHRAAYLLARNCGRHGAALLFP